MKYIVFISALLGGVLLFLLSHASSNGSISGHYYTILLGLNVALAVGLTALIGFQLWHLYKQMRSRVIGSRLNVRLMGAFALMAIIPGMIVYIVSVNLSLIHISEPTRPY